MLKKSIVMVDVVDVMVVVGSVVDFGVFWCYKLVSFVQNPK